ncbi:MAG TPA: hypothetical protein VLH56_14875 [Dissulfurispiraceae bacterium]|nr:hypothetical protein [Dissulfurispiraceae bacterium]
MEFWFCTGKLSLAAGADGLNEKIERVRFRILDVKNIKKTH